MWTTNTFNLSEMFCWKVGKKEVYFKRNSSSWSFALQDSAEQVAQPQKLPVSSDTSELEWSVVVDQSNKLLLLPALPDRSLVVKLKMPFKILPKQSIQLYITVPISLQFYSGKMDKDNLMLEVPTADFTSTWFGETHDGELSYAHFVDIHSLLQTPTQAPNHIICPLKLSNESSKPFEVQRFLLQVQYLKLFLVDDALWTNETYISFNGENEMSDVNFSKSVPLRLKNAKLINEPRKSHSIHMLSKSFHLIKYLTNY